MNPYRVPRRPSQVVPIEVARELQREAEAARREASQAKQVVAQLRAELQAARATPPPAAEPAPPEVEATEVDDRILRLQADLANVRRHQAEQVTRARQEGLREGLLALADTADGVRRALDTVPGGDAVADGLRSLQRRLEAVIARAGGAFVGAVGEAFDPQLHEAVARSPAGPAGEIVALEQVGVRLGDDLVRPARVVVS